MTDENATEAKLAKQKCFERLVVVDNMPMTPTRRIMTRQPRLLDSTRDLAMLYIVNQIDGPDSPEIRAATRDAHFKYLDEHEDILVLGGALLADDGKTRTGSVLIINVEDLAAAEAFSENEPFRRAGLFERVEINRMRRGQWNPDAAPRSAEGS